MPVVSICRPITSSRSRPTAIRPISSSSRQRPRTSRRCWGAPPFQAAKDYFDQYFALGAPKGVQSSVSLLYYDYVGMFVKAMQAAGTVEDTDKIAAELEKMKYQGAVSQEPLFFNNRHQV